MDVGARMSVAVSYTDGQGSMETVASAQSIPVANVNDAPVGQISVSGFPRQGDTMTANLDGLRDEDGLGAPTYQWLRNGEAIAGATGDSYRWTCRGLMPLL
jgi:hypothetical protein